MAVKLFTKMVEPLTCRDGDETEWTISILDDILTD